MARPGRGALDAGSASQCAAVVCPSNCKVDIPEERFQTRFIVLDVRGPTSDELRAFLKQNWPALPPTEVTKITTFACGNVRAALLDAALALAGRGRTDQHRQCHPAATTAKTELARTLPPDDREIAMNTEQALAALYGRVSTDCQDGSLETQLAAGRRFATANNLAIPDELIFLDEDASGSLPLLEREQGRLMMNTIKLYGERVKHLIVPKLDRLGRSLIDLQLRVAELEQMGVAVHFCNLPLPAGQDGLGKARRTLFLQLLSAFAEFERNMIVERINDRMTQKRAKGELCGNVHYGWTAVGTGTFRTNKAGQKNEIRRSEPNLEEQK